jgi:PAS domain-containing protein
MVGTAIAAMCEFSRLPIPGGIFALDGTIVAMNEAAEVLLVRKAPQVLGRKVWDFAPGADLIWPEVLAVAHEQGVYRSEIAIATPRGSRQIHYVATLREHDGKSYLLLFAVEAPEDYRPLR